VAWLVGCVKEGCFKDVEKAMDGDTIGNERTIDNDRSIGNVRTIPTHAGSALGRIDQYELLKELGGGGFGTVYLAKDTVSGIEVAVKGLPLFVRNNREEMENIRSNFALVSRLTHTNIAKALVLHPAKEVVYESEDVRKKLRVDSGDTLMVMDYAPGVTLSQWRRQFPDRKVPLEQALEITRQIASALDYAHELRVVHRDIKPANMMIETAEDGSVKVRVLDFGLAAEIRSSMGRVSREIHDTSGTRPYMAPEQWLGAKQGPATDQYSLAAMFCELVTGEVPFASVFDTGDPVVMMNAVGREPFVSPQDLPKPIRLALARGLAKKPEERFASCGDFIAALEGRSSREWSRLPRPQGGRATTRAAKSLLAVAALAALVVGGYFGWMKYDEGVKARESEQARIAAEQRAQEDAARRKAEEESQTAKVRKAQEEAAQRAEEERKAKEEAKRKQDDVERAAQEAQARAAEYMRLKTRINIKVSDAKERMERINAFRVDSDGLVAHIESADSQWKTLSVLSAPNNLEEAEAAFDVADKAEAQIALDLDWLTRNKSGRDAAKTAEREIDALLTGDITTFKAERYAAKSLGDGKSIQAKGKEAFGNGDFAEAGRLLGEAKAKFAAAAKEAKSFYIGTTLESAREYVKGAKWQDCIAVCEKVLGWDSSNAEAKRLKGEAQSHLVPSLRLVAKIDGREVDGAKVRIDEKDCSTPVKWDKLNDGTKIGPYKVAYESGGRQYYGTFDSVTVDWQGPKVIPVALKEYTGPKHGDTKTITLPGGATMEMIYCEAGNYVYERKPVNIEHGFWLGKYEVTQEQWRSVIGDNPSYFRGERNPVESISDERIRAFILKINVHMNCGARLPTEVEWKYACCVGRTTNIIYHVEEFMDMAWYQDNSGGRTHEVGQKKANDWGFYDMYGNVDECCVRGATYVADGKTCSSGGNWAYDKSICINSWVDFNVLLSLAKKGNGQSQSLHGFRLCCDRIPDESKAAKINIDTHGLSEEKKDATETALAAFKAKPARFEEGFRSAQTADQDNAGSQVVDTKPTVEAPSKPSLSSAARKLVGRWSCYCNVTYHDSLGSRADDTIKKYLPVSSTISLNCNEDGSVVLSDSSGRTFGTSRGMWKYRHGMLLMDLKSDDGCTFTLGGTVNWHGDSFELHYDNSEFANMIRKSCERQITDINAVLSSYVDGQLEVSISTKTPSFKIGHARCTPHVFSRQ